MHVVLVVELMFLVSLVSLVVLVALVLAFSLLHGCLILNLFCSFWMLIPALFWVLVVVVVVVVLGCSW